MDGGKEVERREEKGGDGRGIVWKEVPQEESSGRNGEGGEQSHEEDERTFCIFTPNES